MTLATKVTSVKAGKLSAVKNVMQYNEKIASKKAQDLNIFLHLNEDAIKQAKAIDARIKKGEKTGRLAGMCFALKSNILYKGLTTNCASKVLETFVAPYHASVVNKLLSEDAICLGMVNMDEFACGSSGETSAFGPTKNPRDTTLIPGGTSSGSAAAVAADLCDFALGSDTGGSIRNPASHCGVIGLKPSYGLVSRYGLIDSAMSFDTIGPITKTVDDAALILDVIKGQDNFDTTTVDSKETFKKTGVIGVVNVEEFAEQAITQLFEKRVESIKKTKRWKIKNVTLPLGIALETYYILVYTEFYSGTRKFDGRRFGLAIDAYGGPEVQRRIIGGGEITKAEFKGKYYREALKARNFIQQEFEKIFAQCDVIVLPTVPKLPHAIGEAISVKEMYAYDVFTTLANVAGIPAISVPMGEIDTKSVGLQIMARKFNDAQVLTFAQEVTDNARN